jgi:hypothetical protein
MKNIGSVNVYTYIDTRAIDPLINYDSDEPYIPIGKNG